MKTTEDVEREIGSKFWGEFWVYKPEELDLAVTVLKAQGYSWKLYYAMGGKSAKVLYTYEGRPR